VEIVPLDKAIAAIVRNGDTVALEGSTSGVPVVDVPVTTGWDVLVAQGLRTTKPPTDVVHGALRDLERERPGGRG
jgi:hypothetical protein